MSSEEKICARARKLFAQRDRLEAKTREVDSRLAQLRAEYREETRTFINDMARFRNAVHTVKVHT